MKCCSIKLTARTEERQSLFPKTGPRCHPAILENNDHYHDNSDDDDEGDSNSYRQPSGRKSNQSSESEQPYLSVLNIIAPSDIKAFNTGSSIKRWANKRPRLKSAKRGGQKSQNSIEIDSDNLDVSNIIKELQNDVEENEALNSNSNNNNNNNNNEVEEIDPDIRKLLEKTHMGEKSEGEETTGTKRISFDMDGKECTDDGSVRRKSKRRHKKKSKDKSKEKDKTKTKKKLTKTVSFSLSKPPTPQTEQIIRVDVISNYSVEFDVVDSNRTDAMLSDSGKLSPEKIQVEDNEEKDLLQLFCTQTADDPKELILESRKAVLFPRNIDK